MKHLRIQNCTRADMSGSGFGRNLDGRLISERNAKAFSHGACPLSLVWDSYGRLSKPWFPLGILNTRGRLTVRTPKEGE